MVTDNWVGNNDEAVFFWVGKHATLSLQEHGAKVCELKGVWGAGMGGGAGGMRDCYRGSVVFVVGCFATFVVLDDVSSRVLCC